MLAADPLVEVQTWKQPIPACPACGARSRERSPIVTLVRSTEVNDVMILAQTMLSGMPEPDLRKVLIFADSRQDAAFRAGWMEGRSLRFRLRHMAYRVLGQDQSRRWYLENLIAEVVNLATPEELIPSKGRAGADDSAAALASDRGAVRGERAAAARQPGAARARSGRYEGLGLDEMGPLAESWAREFKVAPAAIAETIESLLDLF